MTLVCAAGYVKLFLPEGEIDFVAAPNLTTPGFEVVQLFGREVKVETSVEIIAKKMWHRGDRITGRDIFDFALVAQHEREELLQQSPIMVRHAEVLFQQLDTRYTPLRIQFEGVDTLNFQPQFDDAIHVLRTTMDEMNEIVEAKKHAPETDDNTPGMR